MRYCEFCGKELKYVLIDRYDISTGKRLSDVAALMFNCPKDKVTPLMREFSKKTTMFMLYKFFEYKLTFVNWKTYLKFWEDQN